MDRLTQIQTQTLLEVCKQLHLSEDFIKKVQDYIDGKEGEEVLLQFPFQDLKRISHNPSATLFLTLAKKEYLEEYGVGEMVGLEEAKRYFDVLFAIGGPSCQKMLPEGMLKLNQKKKIGIAMDKILAVYAYENGEKLPFERKLREFTEKFVGEAEWIRKALFYKDGQSEGGKQILYTLYFLLKYPDAKLIWEEEEKEDTKKVCLLPEDQILMKEYEDCMCKRVNYMLNQGLLSEEIQKISDALHQEKLSDEAKQMVRRHTVVQNVVEQTAGLAFANAPLSCCLKNLVELALFINRNAALNGMDFGDIRNDLKCRGGNFDKLFGIDSAKYIYWAAERFHKRILQVQFIKNREIYSKCCDAAPDTIVKRMLEVAKKLDLKFYLEKIKFSQDREREKIINTFSAHAAFSNVQSYLRGEAGIEQLYACEDQITGLYYCHTNLNTYCKYFGEDDFFRRYAVLAAIAGNYYFFGTRIWQHKEEAEAESKKIFEEFEQEGMDFKHQVKITAEIKESIYYKELADKFYHVAKEVFGEYFLKQKEEVLEAFYKASANGRKFGLDFLAASPQENKEAILAFAQDSSKAVREKLLEILKQQTGWEQDIIQLLGAKKAMERELAIRVLVDWDIEKYRKLLEQALEKEKNKKLCTLLEKLTQTGQEAEEMKAVLTREDMVKKINQGGRSRTLAWAYQTPFSVVHKKGGEEASKEYLQAILLCYALMQPCGVSADAVFLAEDLQTAEFAVYINELFDKWIEAGAEAKKRWVLFAASIHGGMEIVKKLQHQIQEWPKYARGAIASDAVQALALSPDPQALLIVDGLARKFKFKQVKAAAGRALDFAAKQLGVEREELEDRIVPDLGFDEHMERVFDYGERCFRVTITTALEIEVFDKNNKKLKSLPAPGKKDDPEKAAVAYEAYKQMKKQMKTTIGSQKERLELALSSERMWNKASWEALFVKNPLMHQFAIGLIWGIYQDGVLVQSFRYMEDGTFNTEEEEEFVLPEDGKIGLVHPIELSEESRNTWREQLEDYEIVQPIEQLERSVFYPDEEEIKMRSLERFGGLVVNDLSLGGKLMAMGWYRGSILDAGGFYTFYREDAKIGYGVELHFSGSCVGVGGMDDVTIYDARFYKMGEIERGNYAYDKVEQGKGIFLSEVPGRYFSEIVRQIALATASSKERNEDWKTKRGHQ